MARFVLGLVERIIIGNQSIARVSLLCLVIGIIGHPSWTLSQVICGTSPSDACNIVSKGSVFYSKLSPFSLKCDRVLIFMEFRGPGIYSAFVAMVLVVSMWLRLALWLCQKLVLAPHAPRRICICGCSQPLPLGCFFFRIIRLWLAGKAPPDKSRYRYCHGFGKRCIRETHSPNHEFKTIGQKGEDAKIG